MSDRFARGVTFALFAVICSPLLQAQVRYHPDGRPRSQRVRRGPDAEVPGWFYNLGITGLRVRLLAEAPKELRVEHVFAGSPAEGRVRVGDSITGVAGKPFVAAHQNGYGMRLRRWEYDDAALLAVRHHVQALGWQRCFLFFKHEDAGTGPALARRFLALPPA